MKRLSVQISTFILLLLLVFPAVGETGIEGLTLDEDTRATTPHPYDEPGTAKKIKMPSLPTFSNIASATIAADEPVDPSLPPLSLTNTMWAKFVLKSKRVVGFQNFYFNSGILGFSLFTKSGQTYTAVPEESVLSFPDILLATLEPGTYFLRVGILNEPAGSDSVFVTFTTIGYLTPIAYEFAEPFSEITDSASPSTEGWSVKKANANDFVACVDGTPFDDCYFRFESAGANEATTLKANIALNDFKLKKNDLIRIQPSLSGNNGEPNLKIQLRLVNKAGVKQNYVMNLTSSAEADPFVDLPAKSGFVPVKAVITIKNRDKDGGDYLDLDGVVITAFRNGEPLRALPAGVLPVPAPVQ